MFLKEEINEDLPIDVELWRERIQKYLVQWQGIHDLTDNEDLSDLRRQTIKSKVQHFWFRHSMIYKYTSAIFFSKSKIFVW